MAENEEKTEPAAPARALLEKKQEPVLLIMSILAGLTIFFGGASAITILQDYKVWGAVCGLGTLATGAATAGVQFWVRGQVTPLK